MNNHKDPRGAAPARARARASAGPAEEREIVYSDARRALFDADVIMFRGTKFISRLLQAGSHSQYTHSGLIAWWHRRLMLFQAEPECIQVVPLSIALRKYEGRADWYRVRPEHRARVDVTRILDEAQVNLGVAYGTTDLLRTVLHEVAGLPLPPDSAHPHALFCSQYVARCFRVGGLPLSEETDIETFPSEVAGSPILEYQGTFVPDVSEEAARASADR